MSAEIIGQIIVAVGEIVAGIAPKIIEKSRNKEGEIIINQTAKGTNITQIGMQINDTTDKTNDSIKEKN